ncbi:unnamed protein product [Mytilus edulis]|uniref:VWFC domain-containing protein n=1 Tax=Mytilus edulis TaxID=6550 RepID=A0A8S3SJV2_MYTED|nr:unnamed protein product [Mytilus edulis]
MSKTDFLSLDDNLDLDILFGEYTDTDPIVDSDDDFVLATVTVVNSFTFPHFPTRPSGCSIYGKLHPEGSHWKESPCEWCDCVNGQSQCLIADCFKMECVDSVPHPDKCCPVCPNGKNCYFGNTVIAAGKDVQVDSDTMCRCPEQFGFGMTAQKAVCKYIMPTVKS